MYRIVSMRAGIVRYGLGEGDVIPARRMKEREATRSMDATSADCVR